MVKKLKKNIFNLGSGIAGTSLFAGMTANIGSSLGGQAGQVAGAGTQAFGTLSGFFAPMATLAGAGAAIRGLKSIKPPKRRKSKKKLRRGNYGY